MNKNWLYRVLALALVAMLAVPMFALAEDVLPEQVEAAAEAGELAFGEDEVVAKTPIGSATAGPITVDLAYDDPDAEYTRVAGTTSQIFVDGVGPTKKVKFKSSNKKVATVNSEGVLTAVDVGNAKITVTAKTSYGKELKNSFKIKVTDVWRAKKVAAVFDVNPVRTWAQAGGKYGSNMGKSGLIKAGSKIKAKIGEGWTDGGRLLAQGATPLYFDVMAVNDDGLFLDGIDKDGDGNTYTYDRGYSWKIKSGSDKVWVDNADFAGARPGKRTFGIMDNTVGSNSLHFEFFKPGKAVLEVATANFAGNQTSKNTFTIEVEKNKKTFYKPTKSDLNTAKDRHTLYYGIQEIEIKDMETVEVTLFFVNGTDFSLNKLRHFDLDISTGMLPAYPNGYADYHNVDWNYLTANAVPFVSCNDGKTKTIDTEIKSGKISTVKVTYKNKYTHDNAAANSQWGSYVRKATANNEINQPFQDLNSDRFYYIITNLSFDLSGGFYRSQAFNPTINIPGVIDSTGNIKIY
jgi:hypothetical protein